MSLNVSALQAFVDDVLTVERYRVRRAWGDSWAEKDIKSPTALMAAYADVARAIRRNEPTPWESME